MFDDAAAVHSVDVDGFGLSAVYQKIVVVYVTSVVEEIQMDNFQLFRPRYSCYEEGDCSVTALGHIGVVLNVVHPYVLIEGSGDISVGVHSVSERIEVVELFGIAGWMWWTIGNGRPGLDERIEYGEVYDEIEHEVKHCVEWCLQLKFTN